jgi:hypothetical protein
MRALNLRPAPWTTICFLITSIFFVGDTIAVRASDNDTSFDNLDVIDASLNGKLAIQRVGSEANAFGLLSVFAGLKNKTSHALNLQAETIYKDTEGNPVNAGSWITLTLKPHEEKEYRSTSISVRFDPNVMEPNFLIRIRRAPPTLSPSPTH